MDGSSVECGTIAPRAHQIVFHGLAHMSVHFGAGCSANDLAAFADFVLRKAGLRVHVAVSALSPKL